MVVAAGLGLLGGLINGEYPTDGVQPIFLGALLGTVVGRAVLWVAGQRPPRWMVAVAVVASLGGEVKAVTTDLAGLNPWPLEGYLAVLAAGVAAAVPFLRPDRPARRPPGTAQESAETARGATGEDN